MIHKPINFTRIENGNIFTRDFRNFISNNKIEFSKQGIAVVYAPNGTGKTTLSNLLAADEWNQHMSLKFTYDDNEICNDNSLFHVISDQNNRNIIEGETKDFLLGDDIAKEFELKKYIDNEYTEIRSKTISLLKEFSITTKSNPLIKICSNDIHPIIESLANKSSKGQDIDLSDFSSKISVLQTVELPDYDSNKLSFFIADFSTKNSVISMIDKIDNYNIPQNNKVSEIEENEEAVRILEHFNKSQCIVCDTSNIDRENLIKNKTENKNNIYVTLDDATRKIIESIIPLTKNNDPFDIKSKLIHIINDGNVNVLVELKSELDNYKSIYKNLIDNKIKEILFASDLIDKNKEHEEMLNSKPEPTDEDIIYIEEIISNSMNKRLSVERDRTTKNIKITLDGNDFIGSERNQLPLSAGEQNFLSLSFECLKAKNSDKQIIVLDDPISSFDSIYKNKVIFAIVKILENKQRLILTHNLDLLRLLNGQFSYCYKFYLMNNTENEDNGFIALNSNEEKMLTNIKELLDTFREKIFTAIKDVDRYLMALIPFMRGYANIISEDEIYEDLTHLMHGYNTKKVNIADIYKKLFGDKEGRLTKDTEKVIPDKLEVSVLDILSTNVDTFELLDRTQYPLLDKTLKHSFTYLSLRLLVEKTLVEKYKIDTSKNSQLGDIIKVAFDKDDIKSVRFRVMLTSKKTLINEFNHFEGNLSIFQPAIDITNAALIKERGDIISMIDTINAKTESDNK